MVGIGVGAGVLTGAGVVGGSVAGLGVAGETWEQRSTEENQVGTLAANTQLHSSVSGNLPQKVFYFRRSDPSTVFEQTAGVLSTGSTVGARLLV